MTRKHSLDSIKNHAEIASRVLFRANVFFESWWQSAGVEGRRAFKQFWDEHWEFWRFNEHAMQFAFVVYSASLFETRTDTVNFGGLWRETKPYRSDGALETEFEYMWTEIQPVAKSVIVLRSNAMAHRSKALSYNNAFKIANVTPDQIRVFLQSAWRLLNIIEEILGLDRSIFEPSAIESLRKLASSGVPLSTE